MGEKRPYDYLIVGAGLFGSVFAYRMRAAGKKVLVVETRDTRGGNLYCDRIAGINVHSYGAHIFHTSDRDVWDFVNRFAEFNRYTNSPLAYYRGKLYNLPFNMNTFYTLWGVTTPQQAYNRIEEQRREVGIIEPRNLEEQALSLVGRDIYDVLVKGYTEKQWGRPCTELPAFIIKRLPLRFTFDNNYFNDRYQGIPIGGYNVLIDGLLDGVEVRLGTDFFDHRSCLEALAAKVLYTGSIDRYFDYCFGRLEYRTIRFETEVLECENYQGNAVVNYTDASIPYTRIIEHRHFEESSSEHGTVITREYPSEYRDGDEPYYPINDVRNETMYKKYKELADAESNILFGGRLAEYKYYDMHQIVRKALDLSQREL